MHAPIVRPAVQRPDKMRQGELAAILGALRPWSETHAVRKELRQWAERSLGTGVSGLGISDIADELSTYHASNTDQEVAAVLVFMLANLAAGRRYDDYGAGLMDQLVGINERTRRRYLAAAREEAGGDRQMQGHIAFQRWLARAVHYHHELWRRMQAGHSESAARRAIQRARRKGVE